MIKKCFTLPLHGYKYFFVTSQMNVSVIDLKNLSVAQQNTVLLSDVSFSIAKGEFVYLIGKTGSGKSSLLKILYADLPLTKGEATVASYNLKKIKRRHIPYLRRKIGIVFQDFQLLGDRNVLENLYFVMRATGWKSKQKMKQRAEELLKRVGLIDKAANMPHRLSGGEQQKVAIARALINEPEIILADEPTGNLDPETSVEILNLLFEISKTGSCVLMATHDYTMMEKFPFRTLKCENGMVTEVKPAAHFNPLR